MKKNFYLVTLLLLPFLYFFFSKPQPKSFDVKPPLEVQIRSAENSQPLKVISMTKKRSHPPESKPKIEEAQKPSGNRIQFKVVEGMAVAYGDLLLGTPELSDVKEGYYDAPKPEPWPQSEIPYQIDSSLAHPERVKEVLKYFNENTSVRFVPYEGQPDGIVFQAAEKHCLSLLGRQGGIQPIKLSPHCFFGEIAHEVLHALGFIHEQSRTDRDEYVEILWENIDEQYRSQFAMVPEVFMEPVRDFPFDFGSIMLYDPKDFAKQSGTATMRSKTKLSIAPAKDKLSPADLERLEKMYPARH